MYDTYQRNKDSAEIYHSKSWQMLTQLCKARCSGIDLYKLMTTDRVAQGKICHHIVEITEDKRKAYDLDNLIYVGSDSHAEIHALYLTDGKKELQKKLEKFLDNYISGGGG